MKKELQLHSKSPISHLLQFRGEKPKSKESRAEMGNGCQLYIFQNFPTWRYTWFLPPPRLPKTMGNMQLSLEGEQRVGISGYRYIWHYTKHWESSLCTVKGDLQSVHQVHSQVSSVPLFPLDLHKVRWCFFPVTFLATYERLTEEDLVDYTFKRQMIPSSLSSLPPSLSIFWANYWSPAGHNYTWKFCLSDLFFLSIRRKDRSSCLVN